MIMGCLPEVAEPQTCVDTKKFQVVPNICGNHFLGFVGLFFFLRGRGKAKAEGLDCPLSTWHPVCSNLNSYFILFQVLFANLYSPNLFYLKS